MLHIPALLTNKSDAQLKAALEHLPAAHALPVFGAAKQVEHEVAALRALKILGALPDNADEYTLVTTLHITNAKARNLLYQDALRTLTSPKQIDDALRAIAMQPNAVKDGDLFLLEVPQPVLMDALRQSVRQLDYLTDDSCAESIARFPQRAFAALNEDLVPPAERNSMAPACGAKSLKATTWPGSMPFPVEIDFSTNMICGGTTARH